MYAVDVVTFENGRRKVKINALLFKDSVRECWDAAKEMAKEQNLNTDAIHIDVEEVAE